MNFLYLNLIPILMIFLVLFWTRREEQAVIQKTIHKNRLEDKTKMVELAKKFIDKKCIIYTFNSQIVGVIREVSDGAVLFESDGSTEAVNLDFVIRIREYPKKKNGKEKSVVLD